MLKAFHNMVIMHFNTGGKRKFHGWFNKLNKPLKLIL